MFENSLKDSWALVLGSSSGFGEACSLELARRGMNIFGVHLDRKGTMAKVEGIVEEIKSTGSEVKFYNVNVADAEKRQEVIADIKDVVQQGGSRVKVMIHSVAFGTLKRYVADQRKDVLNSRNIDMTLDVMAHSIVYWAQDIVMEGIMGEGGRIFAMTSAGSHKVWPTYGAVSAAKAAIEAHIRQLAVELAPHGITANSVMAGVTDTPALRKIPGNDKLIDYALWVNPSGRLTTTEDVAKAIALLSLDEAAWITGNVIGVDGGEDLV